MYTNQAATKPTVIKAIIKKIQKKTFSKKDRIERILNIKKSNHKVIKDKTTISDDDKICYDL